MKVLSVAIRPMQFLAVPALFSMLVIPRFALGQDQSTPTTATSPDNSTNNKAHMTTADQQSENTSDRLLTQKIRKSIIADKSL